MDSTIVLARIVGIMSLLVGLSFMNKSYITAIVDDIVNSKGLLWFVGFVMAILGALMLAGYSTWSFHWPVLITIWGWLALIKGTVIMLFPTSWLSWYRKVKSSGIMMVTGVVPIIFGIILLYKGFMG
ncbi:MAG: hypothetical protein WDN47_04770 [Candidatus Doudnabacteria bacterium]